MNLVTFVETPVFTARVSEYLDDRAYRMLQLSLLLRPDQGPLIPGTGGLRKLRWKRTHTGKRGGLRVIYYWRASANTCFLLFIYRKTNQSDLTASQAKELSRLVREELG